MSNQQRKTITLVAFILFSFTIVYGQRTFTTNEVRQFMSRGEQNGIEIILNGISTNDAKDGIKKLSKKLDAKFVSNKKSPEILLDDARVSSVSANTIDIYAIITPIDNGSKVTFFTDLGGAFITTYAYGTQYAAMEAIIKDFAQDRAFADVSDQLKAEEKFLKTINKELKSLKKDKEKTLKEIEKAKAKIADLEKTVIKNDAEQEAKQKQIALQEQIIETVKTKRSTLKN